MSDVAVADGQISRRRVVQGIAWAAPAIAIATAVPAAAASEPAATAQQIKDALPTGATWTKLDIGVPTNGSGQWNHAVRVGLSGTYGAFAGAPVLSVLTATLTFVNVQAGPPVASNNGAGYVLDLAPAGWTIKSKSALTVVLERTSVAPGTSIAITNLAVRGSGNGAKLDTLTLSGVTAGGTSFTKGIAVPA